MFLEHKYRSFTSKLNLSGQGGKGDVGPAEFPAVWEKIARCCEATLETTNLCSLGICCCVVDILDIPDEAIRPAPLAVFGATGSLRSATTYKIVIALPVIQP